MIIKDMFERDINREITGVITVGDEKNLNIKQELEEYVVTKELEKHFATFFSNYKKGINGKTEKNGVWISGFFGSGKSHFLKILSYLLENRVVEGKNAIDYFMDDKKITDEMVIADMKLACSIPTDVILFNIDSKSNSDNAQNNKEAILSVLNKVFNQHLGYYGANPHISELEKNLVEENLYVEFQDEFEKVSGKKWVKSRHKFSFISHKVCETLVNIKYNGMDMDSAKTLCASFNTPFNLDIETFAKQINEYIEKQGNNKHVVFLIDEMGQYVGEKTDLMLNLQTVTEDLGKFCKGKAWIMVTSQQNIDEITETKGNDFSKIQGRFDTRLSLSSANVDEVISKRILFKTEQARTFLENEYTTKEKIIQSLIVFNDKIEKKLYADEENFAKIYPFVPYQFDLLGDVLTSIREHGASGKHLAEGERSMVALFKESAVTLMEENENTLVPFYMFYEPLEQFLDHSHSNVISKAYKNSKLVPNEFAVNVLKVLFMIKYVKEIVPNVENITTLMVSKIDEVRDDLKTNVEQALHQLCTQTLVQKNNDNYVFLTNEEQDISKEIESRQVNLNEINQKISSIIFDGIYDQKDYKHKVNGNTYTFQLNQFLDGEPYKNNQNYAIGLNVVISDEEISTLNTSDKVYIILPNRGDYLTEITTALKIDKYVREDNQNNRAVNFTRIVEAKKIEKDERISQATAFLKDAFNSAKVIANGRVISGGNTNSCIDTGIVDLINIIYSKISNIDTPMDLSDVKNMLDGKITEPNKITGEAPNYLATLDMLQFIVDNGFRHASTSLETILKQFDSAPYGYKKNDVLWCVASLFQENHIDLYVSNEQITAENKDSKDINDYLTKPLYTSKVVFKVKKKANLKEKNDVVEVFKDVFNVKLSNSDGDDVLFSKFKQNCNSKKDDLLKLSNNYSNNTSYPYPGKQVVQTGLDLVNSIITIEFTDEFFNSVSTKKDDFLDFAEDFVDVNDFFGSNQKDFFDKAVEKIKIYEQSKLLISDATLKSLVNDIETIIKDKNPYSNIHQLDAKNNEFNKHYSGIVKEFRQPILEEIETSREYVLKRLNNLNTKECTDAVLDEILSKYDELKNNCTTTNDLGLLLILQKSLSTKQDELINKINQTMIKILKKTKPKADKTKTATTQTTTVIEPIIVTKEVSLKNLGVGDSWRIENTDDIEKHLSKLRSVLEKSLEDNTILNVKL